MLNMVALHWSCGLILAFITVFMPRQLRVRSGFASCYQSQINTRGGGCICWVLSAVSVLLLCCCPRLTEEGEGAQQGSGWVRTGASFLLDRASAAFIGSCKQLEQITGSTVACFLQAGNKKKGQKSTSFCRDLLINGKMV